jgi:hypothetical protein
MAWHARVHPVCHRLPWQAASSDITCGTQHLPAALVHEILCTLLSAVSHASLIYTMLAYGWHPRSTAAPTPPALLTPRACPTFVVASASATQCLTSVSVSASAPAGQLQAQVWRRPAVPVCQPQPRLPRPGPAPQRHLATAGGAPCPGTGQLHRGPGAGAAGVHRWGTRVCVAVWIVGWTSGIWQPVRRAAVLLTWLKRSPGNAVGLSGCHLLVAFP